MEPSLRIVFKGMDASPAVETRIRERVARLTRYFDRISRCRVTVEAPHRSQKKGKLFAIHVDMSVPGEELAVARARRNDHAHEDVYVALRDAFDSAGRMLQDYARKLRGEIKTNRGRANRTPNKRTPGKRAGRARAAAGMPSDETVG